MIAVETAAGDRIPADLALIGIGVVPNVEIAAAAGLAVENGILVDETMATASPEVVAVGDCVSFPHWELKRRVRLESVQNAVDQAKTAAEDAARQAPSRITRCRGSGRTRATSSCRWSGCPSARRGAVVRGKVEDNRFSVFHFAGERLLAIDSVNRAADHMVGRRLLAAGISPSPEICADESVDLKALVQKVTADA